jgi:hypothetical protein
MSAKAASAGGYVKFARVIVGSMVVLVLTAGVAAGVWMLYEHAGGGLPVEVSFTDGKGIAPRDSVVYGDRIVGRVDRVDDSGQGVLVRALIAAEHAELVRERSRFWIDGRIGSTILHFDRTSDAGAAAQPGQRFTGLSARPEPDPELQPPPLPRPMKTRPVWLCEVRATLVTRVGEEETQERNRYSAAAVVHANGQGDLLILCPSWVIEPAGPLITQSVRVELIGEGTRVADLLCRQGEHAVLYLGATAYREKAATLWPTELPDRQPLVLAAFDGTAYTCEMRGGELDFRGTIAGGNVALVDGLNLAGFAVPAVGRAGARWIGLHGAGSAIDDALTRLK